MALPEIEPVLARDFVSLEIDQDRTKGGMDLLKKFKAKPGGIPWFVFIDSDGNAVVTSDHPEKGNVGFPAQDFEIDHFKTMLQKVAKKITPDDIEMLGKSLVAFRDVKLPPRQ